MSLNWSIENVENFKEVCWVPDPDDEEMVHLNPVTHNLIWTTISIGMGEITEKNAEEFYLRTSMWQRLSDLWTAEERLTYEDVLRHIGLHTNVSYETKTKWLNRMYDYEKREVAAHVRAYAARNN